MLDTFESRKRKPSRHRVLRFLNRALCRRSIHGVTAPVIAATLTRITRLNGHRCGTKPDGRRDALAWNIHLNHVDVDDLSALGHILRVFQELVGGLRYVNEAILMRARRTNKVAA